MAVNNSIKVGPLVFLLQMFVITENIMKRPVFLFLEIFTGELTHFLNYILPYRSYKQCRICAQCHGREEYPTFSKTKERELDW